MLTESERLQKIMESEQITAKQFSEEVGIQPGTISNILKGRNKPSLEVMQKVLQRFRTLSPEWLILGVGSMYKQKIDSQVPTLFDIRPETDLVSDDLPAEDADISSPNFQPNQKKTLQQMPLQPTIIQKKVKKLLIFYDDDTFEEIVPA